MECVCVCQEGVGREVPPEATFLPLRESGLPASPLQGSLSSSPTPLIPPLPNTASLQPACPSPHRAVASAGTAFSLSPLGGCLSQSGHFLSVPRGRCCHPAPDFRPRTPPTSSHLLHCCYFIFLFTRCFSLNTLSLRFPPSFPSLPAVKEITGGRESEPYSPLATILKRKKPEDKDFS